MSEPITMLTDYLLAGAAFIFAGFLLRGGWLKRQLSIGCWGMAFGLVGWAAALGGTCHGFSAQMGALGHDLWQIMIYSLSGASLMLLGGSIFGSLPPPARSWLLWAALGKSLWLWSRSPSFEAVALDYMASLGLVLLLMLWRPMAAAPWLIGGIFSSGLALLLLYSRLTVGALTAADLYHLAQIVGLGLLYQGARRLRDR